MILKLSTLKIEQRTEQELEQKFSTEIAIFQHQCVVEVQLGVNGVTKLADFLVFKGRNTN